MIAWFLDSVLAFVHGLIALPEHPAAAVRVVSVEPERSSSSESVTRTMTEMPISSSAASWMIPMPAQPSEQPIIAPYPEASYQSIGDDEWPTVHDCEKWCMEAFGTEKL